MTLNCVAFAFAHGLLRPQMYNKHKLELSAENPVS